MGDREQSTIFISIDDNWYLRKTDINTCYNISYLIIGICTRGAIMPPNRPAIEQIPSAVVLTFVGYTSAV